MIIQSCIVCSRRYTHSASKLIQRLPKRGAQISLTSRWNLNEPLSSTLSSTARNSSTTWWDHSSLKKSWLALGSQYRIKSRTWEAVQRCPQPLSRSHLSEWVRVIHSNRWAWLSNNPLETHLQISMAIYSCKGPKFRSPSKNSTKKILQSWSIRARCTSQDYCITSATEGIDVCLRKRSSSA